MRTGLLKKERLSQGKVARATSMRTGSLPMRRRPKRQRVKATSMKIGLLKREALRT
jgi:hypothetical protein